jgi:energy-coupling factor transporter ATP-binding protein EcfA2
MASEAPLWSMFESLRILGLRGFAKTQQLRFAIPNGTDGSGLTIVVGANNAGKSTVVEALRALNQSQSPSFTQGRRNKYAGDRVKLVLRRADGFVVTLESEQPRTSETKMNPPGTSLAGQLFVLPSRRVFSPYFGRDSVNRATFMAQLGFPAIRTSNLDVFSNRLFEIQSNRAAFDAVMANVVDPVPNWTIDQEDGGKWFLKLTRGRVVHTSEGLGERLVSLIYIIDALYDSEPGHTIVIDEPELSLHPALQRKLARLFEVYARDRQIVLATHSPYFVNLPALANGAKIARVHLTENGSVISCLSTETSQTIAGIPNDQNNPHVLGLNAQEVFFLDDKVVLLEGQEDVVFLSRVERSIGAKLQGEIFGWGVGGADKMRLIAKILSELGFKKIVGILEGNKAAAAQQLQADFPAYHFLTIPADDIRTKSARPPKKAVSGLLNDANDAVRAEYVEETRNKLESANAYLND